MQELPLILGIVCLMMAAVTGVFAGGLRRIYSGAFFAVFGMVLLANARRRP
jgi:hypothetical protein